MTDTPQPDQWLTMLREREARLLADLSHNERIAAMTGARLEEVRDLIAKAEQKKRGRPKKPETVTGDPGPITSVVAGDNSVMAGDSA